MADDRDASEVSIEASLPAKELLNYYKQRIGHNADRGLAVITMGGGLGDFDSEREDLLKRIEQLSVDQKDHHRLEWENKQRSSEIWELQKALSSANDALFCERSRLLKLQSENDDLKLRSEEDRKKIQYLLSLTKTGEQEITYLRNNKPDAIEVRPRDAQGERMLRTVYLPTANADSLILKVESLQAQLNEQRQYAAEREEALLRDKRMSEERMASHRQNYEQQIELSAHKVQKLEEMLRHCTRDYIIARREKQENEARAVTAETDLSKTKEEFGSRFCEMKERATSQMLNIQRTTQQAIDTYVAKFQEQVQDKQNKIFALEKTFECAQGEYEERITQLENKLSKLTSVNKKLETRRSQDVEGFVNDVSLLRKKVSVIDRRLHQMRLIERLGEDDRLDRMLQDLENRMPMFDSEDGRDYLKACSSTAELENELQKIQSSLIGIEQKIRQSRRDE